MPVALRRITPAVVQSIQVFFQVVLYAGLFIFAQYLVSGCICRCLPTWWG